jgi:phosphatidylserine decarboxylase
MQKRIFILFQYLLPQHPVSRLVGRLARSTWKPFKNTFIKWFIRRYQVNMEEALVADPESYASFNDFFTRALKPGVRPINSNKDLIVSPADGVINQSGRITSGRIIQAKGRDFSLTELLGGNDERARPFIEGCFATVYLSPQDYHRVHMPIGGTLKEMVFIPGKLFSVNQITAESVPNLFARNERVVCLFDTERGPMAMVLVGAMIVASVDTVWAGNICPAGRQVCVTGYVNQLPPLKIERGEEMGRFKLGSTVILLFGPNTVNLMNDLVGGKRVKLGEAIARPA